MLYKLYSAVHRCPPCRALVASLDIDFPEWRDYIEYVNADDMSEEQRELGYKVGVFSLPSIVDDEKILFKGYRSGMVDQIKEICLTKE